MSRKLGQLEAAALAYVQMRSVRTAKTGDLAAAVLLIFADFRGYHRAWIELQPIIGHRRIQYLTPA